MELCNLESISEMCGIQVLGERGEVGTCIYTDCLHSPVSQEGFITSSPITSNKNTEKEICIYRGCI